MRYLLSKLTAPRRPAIKRGRRKPEGLRTGLPWRSLGFDQLEERRVLDADLQIAQMTDDPDPTVAGQTITYVIAVANGGPDAAANVVLTDVLPAGTTFIAAQQVDTGPDPNEVTFDLSTPPVGQGGTFTASRATLDPGQFGAFAVVVRVNPNVPALSTISNTATISSSSPDPDGGNNSQTVSTSVNTTADVVLVKQDVDDPVVAGGAVVYIITIANAGPSDAQNLSVSDTLPPGTVFISAENQQGAGFVFSTPGQGNPGTVTATLGTLPAGGTATFSLVAGVAASVPDGTILNNTASVTTNTTSDPETGNNFQTIQTTVVARTDLVVDKNDVDDPVIAGTGMAYVITLANPGPSDAQNVTLSDAIPANTTFFSFTQVSGPTFTLNTPQQGETGTVTATIATLPAGQAAAFVLTLAVSPSAPHLSTLTNTASATSSTVELDPSNNASTETTQVLAEADLSVTKVEVDDPVVAGLQAGYGLAITNLGPSDAQNVSLADLVPANTTFASITQIAGPTFDIQTPQVGEPGNILATIATLPAGATAVFNLVLNVLSSAPHLSTLVNTALGVSETTDPVPDNNVDVEETTVIAIADLRVEKQDDPDPVVPGTELTYTIDIDNLGPSDAQNVVLFDELPAHTAFVSLTQLSGPGFSLITPPVGGVGSIQATLSPLVAGESASFELVLRVRETARGGSTIPNTVTFVSETIDPDLTNNVSSTTTGVVALLATGADAGGGPHVKVFDAATGVERLSFFAYDASFAGGVRVAIGDVNNDEIPDIITAPGTGGGPHIRVFSGATGEQLPGPVGSFLALYPEYGGGLFIAAADFNADGFDDIVVGAESNIPAGGGNDGFIRVFSGQDASLLADFFSQGTRVAVGDVNGDGTPDIVTASKHASAPPLVEIFDGLSGELIDGPLGTFFAYDPQLTTGVYVAVADVNGDGRADVITGAGAGGGPHVKVFNGLDGTELHSFMAYDVSFTGGVRVGAGDVNGDELADIITGAGPSGGPHVRAFSGLDGSEIRGFFAYNPGFTGGVFVAGRLVPPPVVQIAAPAPLPQAGDFQRILGVALDGLDAADSQTVPPEVLDPVILAGVRRLTPTLLASKPADVIQLLSVDTIADEQARPLVDEDLFELVSARLIHAKAR